MEQPAEQHPAILLTGAEPMNKAVSAIAAVIRITVPLNFAYIVLWVQFSSDPESQFWSRVNPIYMPWVLLSSMILPVLLLVRVALARKQVHRSRVSLWVDGILVAIWSVVFVVLVGVWASLFRLLVG